jgi:uridylate kinase, putative
MQYVLKIGGHLITENEDSFLKYSNLLQNLAVKYKNFHIVIGGGKWARNYINIGRKLYLPEPYLDFIGIQISQINASIIYKILAEQSTFAFIRNFDELIQKLNEGKRIICGGLFPTISTTTVACIVAELSKSMLLYATNVDGVFDKDPNVYKDARLIKKMNINDLINIITPAHSSLAGDYKLFDPQSLQIIKRSKIPVRVFNGKIEENIKRALENEDIGTIVTS